MNKRIPILLMAILLAQSCLMSRAQSVPDQMNYQGVIANSSGDPLPSGDYDLTFNIYDVPTGGDPVWGPHTIPTAVVDGQFNVALGPVDENAPPRDLSVGFASANSYLEITVGANPAIAPRQKILSAPFAFEAAHAASAAHADTLGGTPGTPAMTSIGTAVTIPGTVTAGSFLGDGTGLTLPGNLALLDRNPQAFTGVNTFSGNVGIGTTTPVARLSLAGTGNAFPATTGTIPSSGTVARFKSGNAVTLDIGLNSTSGSWFQTTHTASLGTEYPLLLNPNGGNVGIGTGTTLPTQKLHVQGNIHASGNVGIGTTTPGFPLTFSDTLGDKISLYSQSGNSWGFGIQNGQLQIHSDIIGGDITFGYGSSSSMTETMRIKGTGNVGIGTTFPTAKLHAKGAGNGFPATTGGTQSAGHVARFESGNSVVLDIGLNSGLGSWLQTTFNGVHTANYPLLLNPNGGNVGIGTTSPTQGKLVVNGHTSRSINSVYLNNGSLLTYWPGVGGGGNGDAYVPLRDFRGGNTHNVSIYASLDVAAAGFAAFSDARIKRVAGRSDAVRDLSTLQDIEVTDYTYIDAVAKGTGQQKKVIAQQIEKIFPQAVRMSTDVVPDIYQKAEIKAGWVELATDLKKGERVRLITEQKDGIHEVLEVAEGRFRTKFKPEGDQIFVYGREVSDFRSVDYEAIAMLNVSATQELARQLAEKAARVTTLEQEVAALKQMVGQLAIAMKASNGNEQVARMLPTVPPTAGSQILPVKFTTAK